MCDSPQQGYARRTTPMHMWRKQAIMEWLWRMISIVACCHSAKLCAHAAWAFRSQQNGAVTRILRLCCVKPSKKIVRSVHFFVKRRGCCYNLSVGIALNMWFTTNGMCVKNNTTYMWHEQVIIEWLQCMISIVVCCHSAKLCAHAAWAFHCNSAIWFSGLKFRHGKTAHAKDMMSQESDSA